jgi:hypothetical protein
MDDGNFLDGGLPQDRDPMDQSGEDRIESPDTNPPPPRDPAARDTPRLDQKWLDEALGRSEKATRERREAQPSRPNQ